MSAKGKITDAVKCPKPAHIHNGRVCWNAKIGGGFIPVVLNHTFDIRDVGNLTKALNFVFDAGWQAALRSKKVRP